MASAPDWIGAVGTVLTLGTGLYLFGQTLKDRRRTHAAKVATWVDKSEEQGSRTWRLHVQNRGEHPIYDCDLHILDPDGTPTMNGDLRRPVVQPNEDIPNFWLLGQVSLEEARASWAATSRFDSLRYEFAFTDTEGRRWARAQDGKLRRRRK
jgi:hypothetical protein